MIYDKQTGMLNWTKGQKGNISLHFTFKEIECKCTFPSCKFNKISKELIDKIEEIRIATNAPLYITSAYRCEEYQNVLRDGGLRTSVGPSTHSLGLAVDIKQTHMNTLVAEADKRFAAIGIAKSFIHVDMRTDKRRRWTYA